MKELITLLNNSEETEEVAVNKNTLDKKRTRLINMLANKKYLVYNNENYVTITDDGNNTIAVKVASGECFRYACDKMIPYINKTTCKRCNGYLAVNIMCRLDDYEIIKNNLRSYTIPQHDLVGYLISFDKYMSLVYEGVRPVICHKNSQRNDNRPCNIEWGSTSENNRQGRMGASLQHYYPGKYTFEVINERSTSKKELNKYRYVSLHDKYKIENKDMHDAEMFIDLRIIKADEFYDLEVVDDFISFMKRTERWK